MSLWHRAASLRGAPSQQTPEPWQRRRGCDRLPRQRLAC